MSEISLILVSVSYTHLDVYKRQVEYIAEAGGSIRDDHVIDTCDKYGIAMALSLIHISYHSTG